MLFEKSVKSALFESTKGNLKMTDKKHLSFRIQEFAAVAFFTLLGVVALAFF